MPAATANPTNLRFDLAARRALITGGSVSIGRAIALGLAEAGADIAIQFAPEADAAYAMSGAAEQTAAEIGDRGRRAHVIAAAFDRPGQAKHTVEDARRALGGLDILVICASAQVRSEFSAVTAEEIACQVATNLTATIELLQAALPGMAAQAWGRVLLIGSVNATRPEPQLGVYAALKAAQHNLVVNLARQYASCGVTLNTLSPGLVATERNRRRRSDPREWAQIQADANPMRRAAIPEEMVGAALLFCSPAGSFITGADLQATGGAHL